MIATATMLHSTPQISPLENTAAAVVEAEDTDDAAILKMQHRRTISSGHWQAPRGAPKTYLLEKVKGDLFCSRLLSSNATSAP